MTTTGHQPLYLNNQTVAGLGAAKYYAVTDMAYAKVTFYLESQDWDATDMDLIISNVRQPLCSEIVRGSWTSGTNGVWYSSDDREEQRDGIYKDYYPGRYYNLCYRM